MIRVDPDVWDVIIEHFPDFVDDSRGKLRRDLCGRDPTADALYFTLFCQAQCFNLASVHLPHCDYTSAEWRKAALNDLDVCSGGIALLHQEIERPREAIN